MNSAATSMSSSTSPVSEAKMTWTLAPCVSGRAASTISCSARMISPRPISTCPKRPIRLFSRRMKSVTPPKMSSGESHDRSKENTSVISAEHHRQRRRGGDQPLAGESGQHQRRRVAALDQRGDAQARGERRKAIGHALAQDAAQVAAVQAKDAGSDDVRAPHEERDAGQQIEEDLHQLAVPAASTALRDASTTSSAWSSSCGVMIKGGESVSTFPWPILKDSPRARH